MYVSNCGAHFPQHSFVRPAVRSPALSFLPANASPLVVCARAGYRLSTPPRDVRHVLSWPAIFGSTEPQAPGGAPAQTLGAKIRAARLAQRLTQEQLGGRDFTKAYISLLERDARTPRLTTLRILARRLDRPLSDFLSGVPDEREAEAYLTIGIACLHAEHASEARAWLEQAVDAAVKEADEVLESRIELALAELDRRDRRIARAGRRVERSFRALIRGADAALLADAQALRGRVKLDEGDAASARWAFEAALRLAKDLGQPFRLADIYAHLGATYRQLGLVQESAEALRRALEAAEPFRNPRRIRAWYLARATAAARQGRFKEAAEESGKALAVTAMIEHGRRLAEIHERLGDADLLLDRWEEARRHYLGSVVLHAAAGNFPDAAQALSSLAEAMMERMSPEAARSVGEAALDLLPAGGDSWHRAHSLRVRGSIFRVLGRVDEARTALEESLGLLEQLRRPDDARVVRQELALLALESQDTAGARRHLKTLCALPAPARL